MPLTLTSRQVGAITVTTCSGRIVDGPETSALQHHLDGLLPLSPCIVLNLADVGFIDSSGLGLLVRMVARARAAHGDLKLSAMQPKMSEVLRVTKLAGVFKTSSSEEEAIAAFYRPTEVGEGAPALETQILCVDPSINVLAYVRELLRQAGYGVMTAANLPDGLILLHATRPKLVVVAASLLANRDTRTAESFHELAKKIGLVELPDDFSSHDAGAAADGLLQSVDAAFGNRTGTRPT